MFAQDSAGGQTSDQSGERLDADVVITASAAGEKNSVWFRYVVISIGIFISHSHDDDDDDGGCSDGEGLPEQEIATDHVIDISDNRDRLVRIVKDKDLKALRRLGGLDWVVSLQRSHFEYGVDDPQDQYWKGSQPRGFMYFLKQSFNSYAIFLLVLSAALLFAIETVEQGPQDGWHDGVAVVFTICMLVSFSSIGNFRRERKAAKKLSKEKETRVTVERNGELSSVLVRQVKMWDTVHLKKGDRVPADGLIIRAENLRLDEVHGAVIDRDRNPFLVSGSKVEEGHGSMIVASICSDNEKRPASSLHDCHDPSEHNTFLQSLMQKPNEYIEKFTLSMSVLIAFVALIRLLWAKKHDGYNELPEMKSHLTIKTLMEIFQRLIFKPQGRVSTLASALVALVIGIQHGMPFVIGCCLSHWNNKLSNACLVLGSLSACCTMGLVTVVVIDATHGDLLDKKTEVIEVLIGDKDIIKEECESVGANHFSVPDSIFHQGTGVWDYVPKASVSLDRRSRVSWEKTTWGGTSNLEGKSQVIEYRRSSSSGKEGCEVMMRRMDDEERGIHLHWKGPPSTILDMCSHFYDLRGERHAITSERRTEFQNLIKRMETNGHTATAFAYEQTKVGELKREGLNLLATVCLKYNSQRGFKQLVKALRDAGLIIKLVSEDEVAFVESIAWDLGFSRFAGADNDTIIEAKRVRELIESSNVEEVNKLLDQISVMGNSRPEDKLRMVEKLQENGHIVAFSGGLSIRDTPTLIKADVVITLERRCVEIAKNASDILLKTPHPFSIARLRNYGRCEYQNIQKFFMIQLTFWISGLFITLVSTIHSGESPLTTAQMIWVNLMLCLLCGLMMVMELDKDDPPSKRTQLLVTQEIWMSIVIKVFCQVLLLLLIHFLTTTKYASTKTERHVWETLIFNTFALCQIFNLLISMNLSKKEVLEVVLHQYWFMGALLTALSFQVIFVHFGNGFFSSEKLSVRKWVSCFLLAAFSSIINSATKLLISFMAHKYRRMLLIKT